MIDSIVIILITIFYAVFFGNTFFLIVKGEKPIVLGKGKKGFKKAVEISFFILLLFWTYEILITALNLPLQVLPGLLTALFFDIPVLRIVGLILMGAGICLFISTLISMSRSWRIGIDTDSPGKLVTSGIFRFSRNPIFVCIDLLFINIFLVYSTLFFLTSAVLIILGIHIQILQEEKFLVAHYGDEYSEYKQKVRRYF